MKRKPGDVAAEEALLRRLHRRQSEEPVTDDSATEDGVGERLAAGGATPEHAETINRLLARGAGSVAGGLVTHLQQTHGNAYVARLLDAAASAREPLPAAPRIQRQAEEGDGQAGGDETQAGGGEGAGLTVQEEFVPEEGEVHTDEDLPVLYVGPDGNEQQQQPGEQEGGEEQQQVAAAPAVRFVDLGRVGTVPVGDYAVPSDDHRAHAFTNGGRTGNVVWAGGGGAGPHTNQPNGSLQAQVAPAYQAHSKGAPPAKSDAWVQAGTGTLSVTRSFVGSNAGDQGNGWWVTAGAAGRLDQHEQQHLTSAQGLYNAHLQPLEVRITNSATLGKDLAVSEADAITALRAIIRWPESIAAFAAADQAANNPMLTVDTADLASGTYPVNAGAGTVGGTAFTNRLRLPGEPNPP